MSDCMRPALRVCWTAHVSMARLPTALPPPGTAPTGSPRWQKSSRGAVNDACLGLRRDSERTDGRVPRRRCGEESSPYSCVAMTRARANAETIGSGTPLARTPGIKPEMRVGLISAPGGFDEVLGALPPGVAVRRRLPGTFDVMVAFCTRHSELERRLPAWQAALAVDGGLWLAWPKRTSGVATDLGEAAVRSLGLGAGLVDNKVCAIDATWSGLRFVYRRADRPGRARAST